MPLLCGHRCSLDKSGGIRRNRRLREHDGARHGECHEPFRESQRACSEHALPLPRRLDTARRVYNLLGRSDLQDDSRRNARSDHPGVADAMAADAAPAYRNVPGPATARQRRGELTGSGSRTATYATRLHRSSLHPVPVLTTFTSPGVSRSGANELQGHIREQLSTTRVMTGAMLPELTASGYFWGSSHSRPDRRVERERDD